MLHTKLHLEISLVYEAKLKDIIIIKYFEKAFKIRNTF